MYAEAAASGSVAVIALRGRVVMRHRKCDELVPRGWLVRYHVLFLSLYFLFAALIVQIVVLICRFLSVFLFYYLFWLLLGHLITLVNILSTNEIEGQQLLDLSKKKHAHF
jgi:hypothetical protein